MIVLLYNTLCQCQLWTIERNVDTDTGYQEAYEEPETAKITEKRSEGTVFNDSEVLAFKFKNKGSKNIIQLVYPFFSQKCFYIK